MFGELAIETLFARPELALLAAVGDQGNRLAAADPHRRAPVVPGPLQLVPIAEPAGQLAPLHRDHHW
jgi:hypothetical protein